MNWRMMCFGYLIGGISRKSFMENVQTPVGNNAMRYSKVDVAIRTVQRVIVVKKKGDY